MKNKHFFISVVVSSNNQVTADSSLLFQVVDFCISRLLLLACLLLMIGNTARPHQALSVCFNKHLHLVVF